MEPGTQMNESYPVEFSVEYPDRALDRLSTAFRILWVIPIAVVLATMSAGPGIHAGMVAAGAGGVLTLPVLLLIVFRQKYPRWWFDWNLELMRFSNRVAA